MARKPARPATHGRQRTGWQGEPWAGRTGHATTWCQYTSRWPWPASV